MDFDGLDFDGLDFDGLDFDPRVEPKANASCNAERPASCQGVPVNGAA